MSDHILEEYAETSSNDLYKCMKYGRVDYLAIAVVDLEKAIEFYTRLFGFNLQKRREKNGKFSGMKSAELDAGEFSIVLVQGTSTESKICQYIENYGPGVQHVAISVDNLNEVVAVFRESQVQFATAIVTGNGLRKIFTKRDENTGMMMEIIERNGQINSFRSLESMLSDMKSGAACVIIDPQTPLKGLKSL